MTKFAGLNVVDAAFRPELKLNNIRYENRTEQN